MEEVNVPLASAFPSGDSLEVSQPVGLDKLIVLGREGRLDENLLRNINNRFRDKARRSLSESSRTPLTILDRARGLCPRKSEWREDAESPSDWTWLERNTAIFGNGEGAGLPAEGPSRQRILGRRRSSMNNAG